MTILRMPATAFAWFQTHPQLWWSAQARRTMGRIAPGEPAPEVDAEGNPTGWVLISDDRIDEWDQIILAVCLAGMAYASALGPVAAAQLVALQAGKDLAALANLIDRYHGGKITKAELERTVKLEVIRQAGVLGVTLPALDADLNVIAEGP